MMTTTMIVLWWLELLQGSRVLHMQPQTLRSPLQTQRRNRGLAHRSAGRARGGRGSKARRRGWRMRMTMS